MDDHDQLKKVKSETFCLWMAYQEFYSVAIMQFCVLDCDGNRIGFYSGYANGHIFSRESLSKVRMDAIRAS